MLVTVPSAIFVASIAAEALIFALAMLDKLLPVPSTSNVLLVNVFVLTAEIPSVIPYPASVVGVPVKLAHAKKCVLSNPSSVSASTPPPPDVASAAGAH